MIERERERESRFYIQETPFNENTMRKERGHINCFCRVIAASLHHQLLKRTAQSNHHNRIFISQLLLFSSLQILYMSRFVHQLLTALFLSPHTLSSLICTFLSLSLITLSCCTSFPARSSNLFVLPQCFTYAYNKL